MSSFATISERFPRSLRYNREWLLAGISGAANPLWMAEWLSGVVDLQPGMRVLDLGCGRAISSIFLHREFGVEVWATDLWFSAAENGQRIRDAGAQRHVFPVHADARSLPFSDEFFDAIVSFDSFPYYGTDDLYLGYLARFVKPNGLVGIAGAGLIQEIDHIPCHLREWWTDDLWCLHSPSWWRRHWDRNTFVDVEIADTMPDGCQLWLDWHRIIAPHNEAELKALEADRGEYLGYVRILGRRNSASLPDHIVSVPTQYLQKPLLHSRS